MLALSKVCSRATNRPCHTSCSGWDILLSCYQVTHGADALCITLAATHHLPLQVGASETSIMGLRHFHLYHLPSGPVLNLARLKWHSLL